MVWRVKVLEFALFSEPVTEAPCDTIVLPVPTDERPLRGDAGQLDWRICARISRLLVSGTASGARGEAVLLPAPRPLGATRILLVGLGPSAKLEGRQLQRAFALMASKLALLRAPVSLLALPGAVDLELDAELLVRGCVQTLSALRGSARICLGIPSADRNGAAVEAALSRAAPDAQQRKVELGVYWAEQPALASAAS